ncbi:7-cyano-7-deazaguanine synthase QueC [Campylobacter insulaenigrae]|uniref:7-cyano-7-deazaguanine synthase n=1 Tax=Campylobacter insulaenigrae TaxID=260714 RepID=A0ABY3G3E6_9BACT|nr:7-cyano-7-deazaguanine synthase QueC [Campylobacter insulaenigrae]MCR6570127.1 7-cyano-7-deazaguanine synthase QueC [Campylobacter insulaenigrae]MCR6584078.1 7-cyano-7-deazaguanine synthase QueC [Campylobacter insulaenigrae]TWO23919.1 7-cyano-7-deazaguanine synthase QueC [Campylobacter insulaenigrae]
MKKALCIISGGMDSTLCAYLAKKEGYEIIALHFDYNQRTMLKERKCFEKICKELKIKNKYILNVSFISDIGGNSLTDLTLDIPKNSLHKNNIPNTYVPFRNGIFLSIAGAIAEKEKCESIFIGVVQEDSSGYPDCSEKFIQNATNFINSGTNPDFKTQLKTPLIHLNKAQIVSLAIEENVALQYTWSCYEREDKACGKCDSCLLRLKGFEQIKRKDMIDYI